MLTHPLNHLHWVVLTYARKPTLKLNQLILSRLFEKKSKQVTKTAVLFEKVLFEKKTKYQSI